MPTISFALEDLNRLVGKKLTIEELEQAVEYAKGDIEGYDRESDEVRANFEDTNMPYLWSVEGVARLLRGVLGVEAGLPKLEVLKSDYKIIVNKSVKLVRPYIGGIAVSGKQIDDYMLKQIIQLQEKFCDSYGRKRKKVSVGVYSLNKIKFPIYYKAVEPESVEFEPLGFKRKMTLGEILEAHPTGQQYAPLLAGQKHFPILVDNDNEVLSFPPIINSNYSGKVEVGDSELFIESCGDDFDAVNLAINIFAQAFYDRGFKVSNVLVEYEDRKVNCPYDFNEKMKLRPMQVKELLGLDLKEPDIKKLLEKARYEYKDGTVSVPNYRQDIMHWVDVAEDIGIMYGYNKIPTELLKSNTIGETSGLMIFIEKVRDLVVGYGYQEVLNAMLTNKETMFTKMEVEQFDLLEIKEYMSESYSVVRNWLLPMLMEILSKNKHNGYPQKIFEQGLVSLNKKDEAVDYERIAIVTTHTTADFTEAKQVFDSLMRSIDVKDYQLQDVEHHSFIPGRVARVFYKSKSIAYIGEFSPKVLSNWGLVNPVAGFELNLTDLYELMKV
jgi:phenylalanyl-tRNA synthetase beta chain